MDVKLLNFFKTFADFDRMRLTVYLSEKPRKAWEIAERFDMSDKDVDRHLTQLKKLGLLLVEEDGYLLDRKAFETLSRDVLADQKPVVLAHSNDEDADDFDRQVIRNYSYPDGRLKEIPTQEKKLLPVLRHVAEAFKPGMRYSEKEVNERLAFYHADYASLRRYLVDKKMISRDANGRQYWRDKHK